MEESAIARFYPDSAAGAQSMLRDNFSYNLEGATYESDPCVSGVWLVTLASGGRVVAYLAGHKDPWGSTREHNDAEGDM